MNLCPSGSYFTLPVNRRTLPIFPRRMMLARPVGGRARGEGTASPSRHLARPRLDAKNTIEPIRPLDTGDALAAECFDMWHVFLMIRRAVDNSWVLFACKGVAVASKEA